MLVVWVERLNGGGAPGVEGVGGSATALGLAIAPASSRSTALSTCPPRSAMAACLTSTSVSIRSCRRYWVVIAVSTPMASAASPHQSRPLSLTTCPVSRVINTSPVSQTVVGPPCQSFARAGRVVVLPGLHAILAGGDRRLRDGPPTPPERDRRPAGQRGSALPAPAGGGDHPSVEGELPSHSPADLASSSMRRFSLACSRWSGPLSRCLGSLDTASPRRSAHLSTRPTACTLTFASLAMPACVT